MTTDQYLSKIERYDRLIANKICEIDSLRSLATSTTIPPKDVNVQSSGDKDKMGAIVTEIVTVEDEISAIIKKRSVIVKQIEGIQNTKWYDTLIQVYEQHKTVTEVEIANVKSYRHKKRLLDDARKEFEKLYGEGYLIDTPHD